MIVIYRATGPMGHLLGSSPGIKMDTGLFRFNGVPLRVDPDHVVPARVWGRRGLDDWLGPYVSWDDAIDALRAIAGDKLAGLDRGRDDPAGACLILDGWRYRLAWAGDDPPQRFDN